MTSVYPLVKLTNAPDVAATVLFDFNDVTSPSQQIYVNAGSFSLGVPPLEGDPDSIFPQYGTRTVAFSVSVVGTEAYAHGKVAAAARWLLRDDCWLMVQLKSSTSPHWFKLYRPAPGDLSFEPYDIDRTTNSWVWQISLPAEPFAYGAKVTLTAATVTNDVAAGTNPMSFFVTTVLGDAPAPAIIDITWSANRHGYRHMLSASPVPSSYTAPIVWQVGTGDAFTAGTDTAAATADATYSNGSYRACSFATDATMQTRLSGTMAAFAAGIYKVLVRISRSDTSSKFSARLGAKIAGLSTRYGDTKSVTWGASTATGHASWLDLGEFTFPAGLPANLAAGQTATPEVAFQMQRDSGSGSARIDAFLLVPVSNDNARTLFVDNPIVGPVGSNLVREYHDGDQKSVYQIGALTGAPREMYPPEVPGMFPVLIPGERMMFHLVSQTSTSRGAGLGGDVPDVISTTGTVRVAYYPRRLFIGDGT